MKNMVQMEIASQQGCINMSTQNPLERIRSLVLIWHQILVPVVRLISLQFQRWYSNLYFLLL